MADSDSAAQAKKRGNTHYKAKEFEKAIAEYTTAISLNANDHTFYSNRAACYAEIGKFEESLADANKILEINPKFAKGYTRKALALQKLNRPNEELLECYQAGLEHCPNDQKIRQGLQSAMQRSGKGLINQQALMSAMMDPEIRDWYENDADFKQKIDTCVGGFPNQQQLMSWLQDTKFMKFMQKSTGFGGEMKRDEVPEQKKDPTKQKPKKPEPKKEPTPPPLSPEEQAEADRKAKAEAVKKEGNEFYKKKDFDKAIEKYKEAQEIAPEVPAYLLNQAAAMMMQGDLDGCEEMCKEAIKVSREHLCDYTWDAKAYNRLATVAEKRGDLEAAVQHLESSLQEVGDKKVRSRLKRMKQSLQKKKAADLLNPEEALEFKAKADDAFRAGKWKEAIDLYAESIKRNPKDPKVYNNRSTALCKVMGWDAALDDVAKAIVLDPNWVKPYLRKAKIEQALQVYHKALKTLKIAEQAVGEEDMSKVKQARTELQIAIQRANMNPDATQVRQQRALQDPEIMAILQDPVIDGLLKRVKGGDASALRKAMMDDKTVADKMDLLFAAGIVQ